MQRTLRWFVLAMAMLIATVSTWAFVVNMLGPLLVPEVEIDAAASDPSGATWNFFGPFNQWDEAAPAFDSLPMTKLPPWWYITTRAPNPYWVPWLAGPVGTFGFGTLSLAALVFIVLVARTSKVKSPTHAAAETGR